MFQIICIYKLETRLCKVRNKRIIQQPSKTYWKTFENLMVSTVLQYSTEFETQL